MTPPAGPNEAFSRVVIDTQLEDVGWDLSDGHSVRYEYRLPDGAVADYVLCDRHGRAAAVVEAKRAAVNLQEAAAQGRAYAEQLHDEAFAHEKPSPEVRYADFVVSGFGREDTVDGATKIKRFKKEKFPQILVSVNMLDTGFDAPEVVNLVLARFTRSVVLYRQMRGRGTRKVPGKSLFTLFDFVGVTDYHDDDETVPEGGRVREDKPRRSHRPRTLLTLDVDDHIDPTTREWVTVNDNGNFVFLDPDARHAALIGARFEAWIGARPDLDSEQRRLLRTVGEYLKANAGELEEFTVDHFVVPPFANIGGLQRALQTFGSEDALARVIADMNAAVFPEAGAAAQSADHPEP
ncbi:MAG: helicase-related protein [Gammaproteobacteria bacterium]|nr:helicase-related protein [Gammaproteobacteria bacterium]